MATYAIYSYEIQEGNKSLDFYLSDKHWNNRINHAIYDEFLVFYNGTELGKYLWANYQYDMTAPIKNFSKEYGEFFNHAYRLCQMVLEDDVPETKIACWIEFFAKERAFDFLGTRTAVEPNGKKREMNPVPNNLDMIGAYHIFGMAYCILVMSCEHTDKITRFLKALSSYNDNGVPYCMVMHNFEAYFTSYSHLLVDIIVERKKLEKGFDYDTLHTYLSETFKWYLPTYEAHLMAKQQDSSSNKDCKKKRDEQKRLPLPMSIDTERAQLYFKKAIDRGLLKIENGKFSWITIGNIGGNSQLAYFCGRVFEYKHSIKGNTGTRFPEEELNTLFGVKRIYSLLTQVHNAKKIQQWRRKIDELFE